MLSVALALALGDTDELVGSAEQLAIDLAGMIAAGVIVVLLQRLVWKRLLLLAEKLRISG